jgi:hypothetical protein
MDRLIQSISREGVLVPVAVYEQDGLFILIDGERRWQAALRLGYNTIPGVVTARPEGEENILRMFNIHMVRAPWQDMPTAWALRQLVDATGVNEDRALADMTGLGIEQVRRYRHALELPPEYQGYIDTGRIPLNFFWELKRNVIDPLAARRPALWHEFAEGQVMTSFVDKRLHDVISDVISLRKVSTIIRLAEEEAGDLAAPSRLDDTLRQLVTVGELTIENAYQDTVEIVVESDRLERRADNIVASFERLMEKARNEEEKARIRNVAASLSSRLLAFTRP